MNEQMNENPPGKEIVQGNELNTKVLFSMGLHWKTIACPWLTPKNKPESEKCFMARPAYCVQGTAVLLPKDCHPCQAFKAFLRVGESHGGLERPQKKEDRQHSL